MKNIHVLPTDKPSRLADMEGLLVFGDDLISPVGHPTMFLYRHIYITSDEEIKPNVFALINGVLCKTEIKEGKIVSRQLRGGATMDICKTEYLQILLTTDQDLIKDGVQAIDDEFLEWFVKNPSCENAYVEGLKTIYQKDWVYKIIIPQEEFKQETLEEFKKRFANDESHKNIKLDYQDGIYYGIEVGTKWQAERMYSEEEVLDIINSFEKLCYNYQNNKDWFPAKKSEWFEQFKKKQ